MLTLPLRRAVSALLPALLWGCPGIPCQEDNGCAPGAYCQGAAGGQGACATDCVLSEQCGAGMVCTTRGQCVVSRARQGAELESPADGAALDQGSRVEVRGRVLLGAVPLTVELRSADGQGCVEARPQVISLQPGRRSGWVPVSFQDVLIGEGGGTFSLSVTDGTNTAADVRRYSSGLACASCPPAELTLPVVRARPLGSALSVLMEGNVSTAAFSAVLFSEHEDGRRVDLPLGRAGAFSRIVPVWPGRSTVGLQVQTADGTGVRRCVRPVDAPGSTAALSVHLGWEGAGTDLDLVVVPPGGSATQGACARLNVPDWCNVPSAEALAPGPDTVEVDSLQDGTWGVLVLAAPSATPTVRAVVTVLQAGVPLLRLGPRTFNGTLGQGWAVARLEVLGTDVRAVSLDQLSQEPPTGAPDTW